MERCNGLRLRSAPHYIGGNMETSTVDARVDETGETSIALGEDASFDAMVNANFIFDEYQKNPEMTYADLAIKMGFHRNFVGAAISALTNWPESEIRLATKNKISKTRLIKAAPLKGAKLREYLHTENKSSKIPAKDNNNNEGSNVSKSNPRIISEEEIGKIYQSIDLANNQITHLKDSLPDYSKAGDIFSTKMNAVLDEQKKQAAAFTDLSLQYENLIQANAQAKAEEEKELESHIKASKNEQDQKMDEVQKSLNHLKQSELDRPSHAEGDWQILSRQCSSVVGVSSILSMSFLFLLLAGFGTKSLIDAGFSQQMAITGSTVCELLAIITGAMFATSKSWSKLFSGSLLAALTATLCFFSFESSLKNQTQDLAKNAEYLRAEEDYNKAIQAFDNELASIQSLPADYTTVRENRQHFLNELKQAKLESRKTLNTIQSVIKPKPTSGVEILEIALRIIGTLTLAMLTHRFVAQWQANKQP